MKYINEELNKLYHKKEVLGTIFEYTGDIKVINDWKKEHKEIDERIEILQEVKTMLIKELEIITQEYNIVCQYDGYNNEKSYELKGAKEKLEEILNGDCRNTD